MFRRCLKAWRWIVAGAAMVFGAYVLLIENFLAQTAPVSGQVLVVESWFYNRPALDDALTYIREGNYESILCVGDGGSDDASHAADRLVARGIDRARIFTLTAPEVSVGERTFTSGVAVRDWLEQERPDVHRVDVFTVGVHARKSHILFAKALGPEFKVGIISARESEYTPGRWWASGRGWYIVLRNTVGYFQALLQRPASQ